MSFDLSHRLQFASSMIQLSEPAQAKHLNAIADALSAAAGEVEAIAPGRRRRTIIASLITAAMLTPAGLAAASDNALPGDVLYSVKQVSEKILVLFDHEIVARHRIEELEAGTSNSAFAAELNESAEAALSQFATDHPLWNRFHETRTRSADPTSPSARPPRVAPVGEVPSAEDVVAPDPHKPEGPITPIPPIHDDESNDRDADDGGMDDDDQEISHDDTPDSNDATMADDHDSDSHSADDPSD